MAGAPYASSGTLESWRDGVGRLAIGQSRLVLAISAAFAGPLLELTNMEGGGLNLFGASSIGKTTALRMAASVWGRGAGDPGFIRSWRATANALEGTAVLMSDTLLPLDEIGVADGEEVGMAVYQLASGIGKARALRDGSVRLPANWRISVLSTGELPMADKVGEGGRGARAGQSVRLLDIPADAGQGFGIFDHPGGGDPSVFAETVKYAAVTSYGTAGPAFVQKLVSPDVPALIKRVQDLADRFVEANVPSRTDGQVRRAAMRLGLVAAAGELACFYQIVPWREGDATNAAVRALSDWIAARGGTEPAEKKASIAQVRRYIEQYGDARFEPIPVEGIRLVSNRSGWRRGTGSQAQWLVLPEVWKSEVCVGLNPVSTARILWEAGMLSRDSSGKFQRPERTPYGPKRVYVITAAILDGDRDDERAGGAVCSNKMGDLCT